MFHDYGLETVKTNTYWVAMPLHRASIFNATLSPRSKCRAFPLTVAICLIGSKASPSLRCHSTLLKLSMLGNDTQNLYALAAKLSEHFSKERGSSKYGVLFSFSEKVCLSGRFTYDISTVVKRGDILS